MPHSRKQTWVHLTLSQDETRGIRFYVNGQLWQHKIGVLCFTRTGQFGPTRAQLVDASAECLQLHARR